MHMPFARNAIALVFAAAAALAGSAWPAQAAGISRIVFSQPKVNADGTLQSSSLLLAGSGSRSLALTKLGDATIDDSASWSPDGTCIVFEHGVTRSRRGDTRFNLFTLDPRTKHVTRLTFTAGSFVLPVWGPTNRIGYIANYSDRNCLAVIEENGHHRDLFCPPRPAQLQRPAWSRDGKAMFVQAGYYTGSLEPTWRSLAYRVDATTGAATVLDDRVVDEPKRLEFSADGRQGVYANFYPYAETMTRVDFATGASMELGTGYSPRWSPDGRRIAFTGEVYDTAGSCSCHYEPLYVINADGSNLRMLTISRTANHAYIAAQWSKDNVHVLATRRDFLDPSLTQPRYGLRIVNADTRSLRSMQAGLADSGAWFER
ncbi:TolB family protein [Cognatiluteimonas telluris]|uniref:TolB family protein n=1 Tax=Cognatiluteimonas telluris TaxID=1104775 RepID=UPI001408670B|nr:PD40 domain-containing protein [Lysobacter telluris]